MRQPVHIFVNPNSHQGKGWKIWLSIEQEVLRLLPDARIITTSKAEDLEAHLTPLVQAGLETCIISAGGDGSIHSLVNMLLKCPGFDKSGISLGAIGLGSSNDFLKPFHLMLNKVPVRINTTQPAKLRDAGIIKYIDGDGVWKEKYFIVNASFGATSEGNWHFNNPGKILRWLKKVNTSAAITYTAVSTILSYRNKMVHLRYNDVEKRTRMSNINILKIPYVSGSLHYKQDILPDDGKLGVNICINMRKHELLQTLFQLQKGKFKLTEKNISSYTDNFQLKSEKPIIFECDGETEVSTMIEISVLPGAIRMLSS